MNEVVILHGWLFTLGIQVIRWVALGRPKLAPSIAGLNSISSAITTNQRRPEVPPTGARQTQFEAGTQNLLDEARNMTENAVGQGQDLNPMIYQYLGLTPQYQDHTQEISAAQQEMDAAQKQLSEAQAAVSRITAIPRGMRTPAMRQQLRQLNHHMPALNHGMELAQNALGRLQTMPKTITGVSRSDPSQIPADSPFSPNNPLNQTAQNEAQMAARMSRAGAAEGGAGGAQAIDPTLVHQWAQAEAQLNQTMAQRYGPDWQNSSVGQAAIAGFNRMKAEQYATWNLNQMTTMQGAATSGMQNLMSLAANQIGLWREPSNTGMQMGNELTNIAGQRLTEQQTFNQRLGMHVGVSENATTTSPLATAQSIGSGLGAIATTPTGPQTTDASGRTTTQGTVGGNVWNSLFGSSPAAQGVGGGGAINAGGSGGELPAGTGPLAEAPGPSAGAP